MKELIKLFLIISSVFFSIFVIFSLTGLLSVEQIEGLFVELEKLSPLYIGMLVTTLLFIDLFIAIPTLTVIILAGYFLGFFYGSLFAILGMTLSGITGYILSTLYGNKLFTFLIKKQKDREEVVNLFHKHGFMMILLSRAMPTFPETSSCLSGITKMRFRKFILAWLISTLPYAMIASYAGSISSLQNPTPAILAAIALSLSFSGMWFFYHRKHKKSTI